MVLLRDGAAPGEAIMRDHHKGFLVGFSMNQGKVNVLKDELISIIISIKRMH